MLHELRIKDFAIIDELRLTFRPGLNVITGETGAGKSIILQALDLLCGGRASPDVIRSEAEAAAIEGLFDPPGDTELLDALGAAPDEEMVVRRTIARAGKGRAYVNGSSATTALLGRLGAQLVHIYGQHEQAMLLRPESHLDFLDGFADLGPLRARMAAAHTELAAAQHRLLTLTDQRSHIELRRDLLEFQLRELEAAAVEADEEERLRREREIARHAERLQQICREADAALYSGERDIIGSLAGMGKRLREMAAIDPTLAAAADLVDGAGTQLDEAARHVRSYAERLHVDAERREQIEERLALLSRLARKHGVASGELPTVLAALRQEWQSLEHLDDELAATQRAVDARLAAARTIAEELSAVRQRAGSRLETLLARELAALGMRGASFRVTRDTAPDADARGPDATGIDVIEFHFCANPGEALKPLARVASGGELSRIMLALKGLTAAVAETPILIFDEVDAGIGGTVADAVAQRLKLLAQTRQLLCITHVPQIAAYADHHFAVEKRATRGRTVTSARLLTPDERVAELARMLGGSGAPAEAERYARRLIAQASMPLRTTKSAVS